MCFSVIQGVMSWSHVEELYWGVRELWMDCYRVPRDKNHGANMIVGQKQIGER